MAQVHRFRLGEFDGYCLSDGSLNYRPEMLFANAPIVELEALMRRSDLPTEHVTTPYTCLLLKRGDQLILIDTGAGNLLGASAGKLGESLKEAGFTPRDIGTVILTHAHPDHVGGNLDAARELVYPNAVFFILRQEWAFWTSEAAASAPERFVQIARSNLEPIRDRVTLIDDDQEIVQGIRAVSAIGHTPGHMELSITSGDEQLLHVSDTVLYPWHLRHPDWLPVFDLMPEAAAQTKKRVFDRAAAEKCLVFAHHFPPFPAIGHIERRGDGWEWLPVGSR